MKLRKDKWEKVKLGDICNLQRGLTYSSKELGNNEGVPFYNLKSVRRNGESDNNSDFKFFLAEIKDKHFTKFDDILIALTDLTPTSELIGSPLIIKNNLNTAYSADLARIEFKVNKILPALCYNFLLSKKYRNFIVAYSQGTNVKHLRISGFYEFQIPLPPLEEQKQIATLFQSIETAMEQVDGQEKNLHQLKHKLLRDLFSEKQEFGKHLKGKDFETVKFEKIAINISERVEPKKTELTTYVGLEHLDADNLKIERTGTPDDVIGTKLKIYKGDIIFGKRRAYLRKVAVSHFDGIASAHSMILRANEKNIEKDFLPYFMQSDTFMSRAVQISEGSLSPTIKNKTLAVQEFILPKKEKQKELIVVFKQFDTTIEQLKQQKTTLKLLKQKLLNEILG